MWITTCLFILVGDRSFKMIHNLGKAQSYYLYLNVQGFKTFEKLLNYQEINKENFQIVDMELKTTRITIEYKKFSLPHDNIQYFLFSIFYNLCMYHISRNTK